MAIKRFTDEEIYKANNVNIVDYINDLKLDTKRAGRTLRVEGYGGLYIDPSKNRWNCFAKGEGGGPIQLVMFLENKSWVEAIKTLLGSSYESSLIKPNYRDIEKEENKEFSLPEKNNTYRHMIAYLIKARNIEKDVVYKFIQNNMLYEDKKRNCVFIGCNKEGEPKYAGLRGTNQNRVFKGEVLNSDKAHSFNITNNDSDTLYVFESPIELMSYMSIYKQVHNKDFNYNAISLGGVTDVALEQFLIDNRSVSNIYLCLNNDEAGREATEEIKSKYNDDYGIEVIYPRLKDYNEDLIYVYESLPKEQYKEDSIEIEEEFELEL
jgi:hypothetical protein